MRKRTLTVTKAGRLALGLLAMALGAEPAWAHKIYVFAYADGATLHGEVYARGGEPVRGANIDVFDPAGEKLGAATSDGEGTFTFEARFRCDHRLVADAGGGHAAEYTLSADELPDGLPARGGGRASAPPPGPVAAPRAGVPPSQAAAASPGDASLHEALGTLDRQVVQLRRQLDAYQHKMRLQDVLGAIGYILGLAGAAFYFLGVKKRDAGRGMRGQRPA